jgi:hypothetical protein
MLGKKQSLVGWIWIDGFRLRPAVYSVVDDWDVITHAPQGTFTDWRGGSGP